MMTTELHFQCLHLLGLELQAEKMFVHVIGTPRLHQNHILSSCKLLFLSKLACLLLSPCKLTYVSNFLINLLFIELILGIPMDPEFL